MVGAERLKERQKRDVMGKGSKDLGALGGSESGYKCM